MEQEKDLLKTIDTKADTILGHVEKISSELQSLKGEDNDPILEFAEVCHMLRMSERHVHRIKKQGDLTGFLIGRRRLYRQSEVLAYIKKIEIETRGLRVKQ